MPQLVISYSRISDFGLSKSKVKIEEIVKVESSLTDINMGLIVEIYDYEFHIESSLTSNADVVLDSNVWSQRFWCLSI